MHPAQSIEGFLIGTAVGDSLGLPREGLAPPGCSAIPHCATASSLGAE
jgi:hypothetical protein